MPRTHMHGARDARSGQNNGVSVAHPEFRARPYTGYPATRTGAPITDPASFNHSTKIAILQSVTPG